MNDSETQHLNSALDFFGFRKINSTYELVPTTKEEVAFMVATAGGGYVLKVAGKAGVKVIRSFKSKKELDEAVEQAQRAKVEANNVANSKAAQAEQRKVTQTKAACANGTVCFTAGTLIETKDGLKAIETFTGGELIWSRNDITLEYGYRPVIATKATPDQPIFQVTVKNHQGDIETLETTAEHPFWIKDTGWLKASLLEQGMILLDRNNQEVEVLSQYLLPNHTNTVYNIEVDNFHTYHVGRLGVWVHNADCCGVRVDGTTHGNQRFHERGFTQEKVNDIVNNYSEKGYQPGGLTVYVKKKQDSSYDVIIVNKDGQLVTAVGGNESKTNLPNRRAVMRMLNNNGGFSGVPLD